MGAVTAVGGALLLLVATLLHPLASDPNDPASAFAEYAQDSLWVWSHLGQFLGIAMLAMSLVALASTLESGPAAAWGRVGSTGAAVTIATAAALQAVDGVALKVLVDRWAAASTEARSLAFEAAFVVRQIEIGLAALLSLASGLTLLVFGLAIVLSRRSRRYPVWLGGLGLVAGLAQVAAGVAQATTGFSGSAMTLSMVASALLLVWGILAGVLMWREVPKLAGES